MSLTQLCRCSHFPAPVALRAPRGPTISSWVSPGFHHLSNTEVSTSHGFFFNGDFFCLRGPHLIFQRKPTGQIENHLPSSNTTQRVSSSPGVLEPGRRPSEGPKTSWQGKGPRCDVGKAKVLHRRRGNGGPGL